MKIAKLENPFEKSRVCEKILRSLPEWFGIESAILDYIKDVQTMETWVAIEKEVIGFISLNKHNQYTAEIHVMGILQEFHGKNIGSTLLQKAEESLAEQGFKFLTVKTLSESRPDKNYDKTRRFYLKSGFTPIEEFKTLWGEHNPCLMLVKNIGIVNLQKNEIYRVNNMKIRKAVLTDAAEIANVQINSWRETYHGLLPQDYLNELPLSFKERMELWSRISTESAKALFVAEGPDGIVGFVGCLHSKESTLKEYGELGAIYLLKKYQGQGIGFGLFKVAMQKLLEWNYQKAYCWMIKGNPTEKFYLCTGAVFNGVEKKDEISGITTIDKMLVWDSLDKFK